MMASKIARAFLRSQGIDILDKPHTKLEIANFCAGTGTKRYSLPFHILRMSRETGDSKATMGHAKTLDEAREYARPMLEAHGLEMERPRYTYYIRDIRNGKIYDV